MKINSSSVPSLEDNPYSFHFSTTCKLSLFFFFFTYTWRKTTHLITAPFVKTGQVTYFKTFMGTEWRAKDSKHAALSSPEW